MTFRTLLISSALVFASVSAHAEEYTQWSAPAAGSDSITNLMGKENVFMPHEDDCGTGEEFIKIWDNEDGTDIGFCMEEDERTAAEWTAARDTCLNAGMRLPEPGEFKFACENNVGLNDMTDTDWEWVSNFATHLATDDSTPNAGISVPVSGHTDCDTASTGWSASTNGTAASYAYRCVR